MKNITATTMLRNTLNDYNKASKEKKTQIIQIVKRRLENHNNEGLQLSKEYLKAANKFLTEVSK